MARQATVNSALREFVQSFPPLKVALAINDAICYVFQSILGGIWSLFKIIFRQVYRQVTRLFSSLSRLLDRLPLPVQFRRKFEYKRIHDRSRSVHEEPIPHRNEALKRFFTYQASLTLGVMLYIFVYYVLIKHHSHLTIAVALLLWLAYMVVLENSHKIRSILMLCLPIMFTNRGRALVFCCMLTILVTGPVRNSQVNIQALHDSLNCSKQYLVLKADEKIEDNVVNKLVNIETVIRRALISLEEFMNEIKGKFQEMVDLAVKVERYLAQAFRKLIDIVNICNTHTQDLHNNCINTFKDAYDDCKSKLGGFDFLCSVVKPLDGLCTLVELPETLCLIPESVAKILQETIIKRLEAFIVVLENELYVNVTTEHSYEHQETVSKPMSLVLKEIKYDVDRKFWYISIVTKLFNLVSLILVIWILITSTLYHMHYLAELSYDNMYIDKQLYNIDQKRLFKRKKSKLRNNLKDLSTSDNTKLIDDDEIENSTNAIDNDETNNSLDRKYLFPMTREHERLYLRPFSWRMNDFERHKLFVASFVWIAIIGYIGFFVLMDYAIYRLIQLINEILRDVLFNSDLPIVEVTSKNLGGEVVRYNRTHLRQLSLAKKKEFTTKFNVTTGEGSFVNSIYRRLMDTLENDIPDDLSILDSLENCLPQPKVPNFRQYKKLALLSMLTFGAVILEAYALRLRHVVANLYYPMRAKNRAEWLYKKMMIEKPKFAQIKFKDDEKTSDNEQPGYFDLGLKLLAGKVKR